MKFVLECHECKWSTVVASDELENWITHHASTQGDRSDHTLGVRLVPEVAADPDDRFEALENRRNFDVVRTNKLEYRIERLEQGQRDLLGALRRRT